MAEQEREDFWGCILTDKQKKFSWNGPSDANDDVAELDISHRLVLSQACLGPKPNEAPNLIQATSLDAANNKVSVIIASLQAKSCISCPVHLTFFNPVSFELIQGSGPVHLSGNHIQVLNTFDYSDSDSSDEEETQGFMMDAEIPATKRQVEKKDPKGPPVKKAKMQEKEEESSDEEMESEEEEKETKTESKNEKKKVEKEDKKEEKTAPGTNKEVEKEEPKGKKGKAQKEETKEKEAEKADKKTESPTKGQKKGGLKLDDLVEQGDSEDDSDFEDSEGESDSSDDSGDGDFEFMEKGSDEDSDDEEGDDSEDESDEDSSDSELKKKQPTRSSPRKSEAANTATPGVTTRNKLQNGNVTPKTTPAKEASKNTPSAPKSAAKKTPQGVADIDSIKQTLLKTPNLPRKADKFKNYMKSRFKVDDDKMVNTVWDWLQKNKK